MLADTVIQSARRYKDRVAIQSASGLSLTYAELDQTSDEVAAGLCRRGLKEGDLLLLVLPSGLDYVVAYIAAAKLGVVSAGINPRLSIAERCLIAESIGADLVVTTADLGKGLPNGVEIAEIEKTQPGKEVLSILRVQGHSPPRIPKNTKRPVCVCFTSGSTGPPKGAWFTESQLKAAATLDAGGVWGRGHFITVTSMAHVGFMTKLPWQLARGSTIHVMEQWSAREVLKITEKYRMTAVTGVPAQIALLLSCPEFDSYNLSSIDSIVVGGGPSPPKLIEEARRRLNASYSNRYSSTESGGTGLATALSADDEEALYTVGRCRPGVKAEIRDEEGKQVANGEVGELWLRTPTAMSGYWKDPQRTSKALENSWLRTGDLAHIDEKGCFRLSGRTDEMFIRGGYNIYPQEIEAVLNVHPAVAEVVVIPRPDQIMGHIGVAVVIPNDPSDPPTIEDLRFYAQGRLADYKWPDAIVLVDELPTNSGDKIDRQNLANKDASSQPENII